MLITITIALRFAASAAFFSLLDAVAPQFPGVAAFLSATPLPVASGLVFLDMLREGARRPAVLCAVAL